MIRYDVERKCMVRYCLGLHRKVFVPDHKTRTAQYVLYYTALYPTVSCRLASPGLAWPCLASPGLAWICLAPHRIAQDTVPSCRIISCPILSCPALSCHILYYSCTGFTTISTTLRFKQAHNINDFSAALVAISLVSSEILKCRLSKWLSRPPYEECMHA